MSVQDKTFFNLAKEASASDRLWKTLNRIQSSLQVSTVEMANILLLTEKGFLKLRSAGKEPNARSAMALCDRLHLGFDKLVEGNIDFVALNQHFRGNRNYVPEKYLSGALGKRRIAIDYISRVEAELGWSRRNHLMRHLQINDTFFSSPDENMNIDLTADILEWVFNEYRNEDIILGMGNGIILNQNQGPIGKALSASRNLHELYEMLIGEVLGRYWEKNYLWSIHSMNADFIKVRGVPNPEIMGLVSARAIKNSTMCILRRGIMGSIPTFLGYPVSEAKKTSCVAKGDVYCEFELSVQDLTRKKKVMRVIQ